jgi:hypothetical protein
MCSVIKGNSSLYQYLSWTPVQTVCSSTAISSIQKIQIGCTARSFNVVLVEIYKLRKQVLLKCCYTFEWSEVFNWYVYVLSLISTDHLANFDVKVKIMMWTGPERDYLWYPFILRYDVIYQRCKGGPES